MKWNQLLMVCAAAVVLVGCSADRSSTSTVTEVKQLSAADAEKLIASHKGKVVVVNFWATWCGPCRMEMPGFIELQKKYGPHGLQIVGLSIDDIAADQVLSFARKSGLNYPVHIVGPDTMKAWGNFESIPMTFVLDAQGKKVWEHEGYASPEEFEKQIKPLLPAKQS